MITAVGDDDMPTFVCHTEDGAVTSLASPLHSELSAVGRSIKIIDAHRKDCSIT